MVPEMMVVAGAIMLGLGLWRVVKDALAVPPPPPLPPMAPEVVADLMAPTWVWIEQAEAEAVRRWREDHPYAD